MQRNGRDNRMRKGYLLNEMLVVIAVLAITLGLSTKLLKGVVSDIPKMQKDFQSNVSTNHMLDKLQNDIEAATALPKKTAELESNEKTLLIALDDSILVYTLEDDKIVKSKIGSADQTQPEIIDTWHAPNAKVSWKVWQNHDNNAIEVTTYIERNRHGKLEKKLKNSHVYFVGLRQKLTDR